MKRILSLTNILLVIFMIGCSVKYTDQIKKIQINARSFIQLGNEAYREGRYEQAAKYFDRARLAAISIDDLTERANADNNLGHLFIMVEKLDLADQKFEEAQSLSQRADFRDGMASALNGRGVVAMRRNAYEEASQFFRDASKIKTEKTVQIGILSNLGELERMRGNALQAKAFLDEAIDKATKLKKHRIAGTALYRRALISRDENKYMVAIEFAKKALLEDKKVEFRSGIILDLSLLSELYGAIDDESSANDYKNRAKEAALY